MGTPMALRLLAAGHELSVWNRTEGRTKPLICEGAIAAATPAEAELGADVVITMLFDDAAHEEVLFGPNGLVDALSPGALHISCSTISVALSDRLTAAHAEAGQDFIAAPVFGRPDVAASGQLSVIAAGPPEAIAKAQPLLDAIGRQTFAIGDTPSAANLVKLSGNFLIASVIEALGAAMALVGKAGIDKHQYLDILTGTLFGAPVYKTYGGLIADAKFSPAGFAALLGQKDIRLALAAAEALNVPLPLASLLRDRFLALIAQGGAALDWSAIASLAARDAGAKPD